MTPHRQMTMEQQNRAAVALEAKHAAQLTAQRHAFAEGLNGTEREHWLDAEGRPLPVLALAQALTALEEEVRLTSPADAAEAAWLMTFLLEQGAEVRVGPRETGSEAARHILLATCLTKLAQETGEPSPRRRSYSAKLIDSLRGQGLELRMKGDNQS